MAAETRGGWSYCITVMRKSPVSIHFILWIQFVPSDHEIWSSMFRMVFLPHFNISENSAVHTLRYVRVYLGILSPDKFTMEAIQCFSVLLTIVFESCQASFILDTLSLTLNVFKYWQWFHLLGPNTNQLTKTQQQSNSSQKKKHNAWGWGGVGVLLFQISSYSPEFSTL